MQILTLQQFKTFGEDKPLEGQYKCPVWGVHSPKWVSQEYCEGFGRGVLKEKAGCKYLTACPSYQNLVKGSPVDIEDFHKLLKKGLEENDGSKNV